ncbi:glycosyltransferase [Roseiconus nitratireducens]|uniref:Glycosyltransferase n=1 Tax=Roseiconus nitratireducens TaxID=2605748 RepID=A0A5M6D9W3_9BACT|nr:TIGR04282 family arsenosugar biosynthesis glycosyltransferase [Roseiconus nitratireducens]KAA5544368.1 glycosyltransferase [Roseiconus nitratireducens]
MNDIPPRQTSLGILAKHWTPGQVKTRLGHTIGMHAAAEIHRLFCKHLARRLADAAERTSFVVAPADKRNVFTTELPATWQVELQSEGDLGRRMGSWFAGGPMIGGPVIGGPLRPSGERNDDAPVSEPIDRVLVGADCPMLAAEDVRGALRALRTHDVVLGPADDGGYYLIGLRGPWQDAYRGLFEGIAWSTATVFEVTLRRAAQAGLKVALLEPMSDVDTLEDLQRLRRRLAQPGFDAQDQTPKDETLLSDIDHALRLAKTSS